MNFRLFNQRYGKGAGDQALISLAARIKACSRKSDCLTRYSGDIYAALLTETDQEGSVLFAERLRKSIEILAESGVPLSLHIACTTLSGGQRLFEFGESAGRALAHAKTVRGVKTVHAHDLRTLSAE